MTTPSPQSPNEDTDQRSSWATSVGTIRRGMKVIGPDGDPIGTVSRVEGERVILAEHAAGEDGPFIAVTQIDGVSEDAVLLQGRGDATFGLAAEA